MKVRQASTFLVIKKKKKTGAKCCVAQNRGEKGEGDEKRQGISSINKRGKKKRFKDHIRFLNGKSKGNSQPFGG